jgi:hypothetical protein
MHKTSITINELLGRLERATGVAPRRSGVGWQARCPAHDDRQPSLSVRVADSGHLLVKCHAGCTAEAITKALGLDVSALMPAHRVPKRQVSGVRCRVPLTSSSAPGTTAYTSGRCCAPNSGWASSPARQGFGPEGLWTWQLPTA